MALLPKLSYIFNGIRILTAVLEFWQNDLKVHTTDSIPMNC